MGKDISIVIPYYNTIEKLKRLLKSIDYNEKIEVIVVDDNSKKENEALSLKAQFSEVKFLKNESKNKGAGAARNYGLKVAKGEWVFFADSDDFLLKKSINYLLEKTKSKKDIVYFLPTSCIEGTDQKSNRHIWYKYLIDDYYKTLNEKEVRYHWHAPWSKLIRKKLLDKYNIRFDEIIASNDINFSLKAGYYARNIEVCTKVVYCITKSKGTLTTTISKENFYSRYGAALRFNEFLREKNERKYELPMLKYILNRNYTTAQIMREVFSKRYKIIPPRYRYFYKKPSRLFREIIIKKESYFFNKKLAVGDKK